MGFGGSRRGAPVAECLQDREQDRPRVEGCAGTCSQTFADGNAVAEFVDGVIWPGQLH